MSLYTIIDIETTGFGQNTDDILEVGYLQMKANLEIVRSGSLYFYKPEYKIESQAQSVHKLTRSFLKQFEDDFDDNIVSLFTLMYQGIIIGKNSNGFDIPFIQSWMRRNASALYLGDPFGVLDLQTYYTEEFRKWYAAKHKCATQKKGSLSELIEMIGFTQEEVQAKFDVIFEGNKRNAAHSALYDVYMTYLLVEYAVANYGMKI